MSRNSGASLSCKSLLSSGKSSRTRSSDQSSGDQSQIQHTIHIQCNVTKVKAEIVKEQDEKRINELKRLLPKIEEDNWKYRTVDDLLGLTS